LIELEEMLGIANEEDLKFYRKYGKELKSLRKRFDKILKKLEKDKEREEHGWRIYSEIAYLLQDVASLIERDKADYYCNYYENQYFKKLLKPLSRLRRIHLIDHAFLLRENNEIIFVSEPYQVNMRDLEVLIKLCKEKGYCFDIVGNSLWHPGQTLRIRIWKVKKNG